MKALVSFISLLYCPCLMASGLMHAGSNTNHFSIFSASKNPAMAELVVPGNQKWRMNYAPSFSNSTEYGEVDNFVEELEDLADLLDDPGISVESVQTTLDHFNSVLSQMGDEGYLNSNFAITAPIFPLYFRSGLLGGTLFSEISVNTLISTRVLDDTLAYDEQNGRFSTNTSLYLKGAIENRVSLGYGRQIDVLGTTPYDGEFYVGVKVNVSKMELSKTVLALTQIGGEDITDVLEDEFDNNSRSSTGVSVDAGFIWDTEHFRAGITARNINGPAYKYGSIGTNCESLEEATIARSNCEIARYYAEVRGEISANETYREFSRTTLDGLIKINKRWMVSGEFDTDSYADFTGNIQQWLSVTNIYEPASMWAPSTRIGFHKNLAGTELSSVSVGLTFLKGLILDLTYGMDKVTIDGTNAPRSFGFFIGYQENF